ncbi:MAG: tRNA 2-thiocytidine biosynthesis TtcA family protein [Desulfarculus sp.]|nr:tRNA 2-thiocytidine biosynthesis TtcA family protein [Pseudomonadota bacterium]MBU4597912.1 tRNA 2-thiocytidine biosynthesis TtcA family protein [Pseudomonadota bacterium]MBV1715265.1 tRNA 2-thiocytidine biosynthesis TtcA family protein [Desulfarculus sp.]MBV1737919.1 tRNA 2-thiocytidine biosynthesis TtcA family protein [Desulfarculus sp.]
MAYVERQAISLCGKAVHGWSMIKDQDRVAIGLSGGKDSLCLTWLLAERLRRVPIDYKLIAFHVEMGFGATDHQVLREFCEGLRVEFRLIATDYGPRAHSPENRENSPCFFCALKRRQELFQAAGEAGCRKLALAHHQDDIFETTLMNMFYSGSISTMLPVQPLFHGDLVLIRPLSLMSADITRRFCAAKELPVQPSCCPSAGESRRGRVRELLEDLHRENKKLRPNLWHALTHSGSARLPTPPSTQRLGRPRSK